MINKRLIATSKQSMRYVKQIALLQILAMLMNVLLVFTVADFFSDAYYGNSRNYLAVIAVYLVVIATRAWLKQNIATLGAKTASEVKVRLRTTIYQKMLDLGGKYTDKMSTAEVVQVASEGVEQLEMYFANYLPQFFYCMVAPLILFLLVAGISFKAALVLFLCVPLIPISIVIVQKISKKLLAKYWGLYTGLGEDFLENIQGMTTLKIYGADEVYHKQMNQSAENFRKVTMKVLTMQLNSIIIMDVIAYGGASLGAIIAIIELQKGTLGFFGACVIILLSAEFFLPMRLLGSFFHVAMNGMSASKKMFEILDMKPHVQGEVEIEGQEIAFHHVRFSYDAQKTILQDISFVAKQGLTSIVGVSGSGKSTISSLLVAKLEGYHGEIIIGQHSLSTLNRNSLYQNITRVTDKGYIFEGTVRTNLQMAKPEATTLEMVAVLKRANIWALFAQQSGLDTAISERGANLSGGEKQRLNIARALLKDSPIYIFDEITSNIDVESEDDIMQVILLLAKTKTVVLISHRLQNVVQSNQILMLKEGGIIERGTHSDLLALDGEYAALYNTQKELEGVRL
ncbi:MAG: ABC transporter ATP-binding protein/permease [Faecalibacterium sp.]